MRLAIVVAGLLGTLATQPALADEIEVKHAWTRAAPASAAALAGFLTLHNRSGRDVALVGAESPAAARVELHTHSMEDGVMRMREIASIPVAAGETVHLGPGGLHLMLIGPTGAVAEGDEIVVTLRFDDGEQTEIVLTAWPAGSRGPMAGEEAGQGHGAAGHEHHAH